MLRFIFYYFFLVLLIGGLAYTPWVLASYGMFPSDLTFVLTVFGGLSPTFAAVIVVWFEFGWEGFELLYSQFSRMGFSKWWILISVLVPLAVASYAVLMLWLCGNAYVFDLAFLSGFPVLLLVNFLMNMWEEIGWRGYALPKLQHRYNALVSSLVVGVFWALWHWPLFAVKNSVMAVNYVNFLWFFVFTLLHSFCYSWIYNSTDGSLLAASLYHAATNAANMMLFEGVSTVVFPYYFLAVAEFALILVLVFKPDSLSRRKRVTLA